ncbi:MAG: archaeosortase/exosortase family protein [bacterium]
MKTIQKAVLACAIVMLTLWLVFTFWISRWTGVGISHVMLGVIFAVLILVRPKPENVQSMARPATSAVAGIAAVAGTLAFVAGTVFDVMRLQWLGVLLILFGVARWSLPEKFSRDTFISLILLYWIYPVPGQVLAFLHAAMQAASVQGAEYLLHALNYRVWADGSIIRTAVATFMVPEACSGLATATTVLMCGAGIGILLRLRLLQVLILMLSGAIQVVLLNIGRIALMVMLADPAQPAWAGQFLHDSLGVLLLVSVVLIQVEASWLRSLRRNTAEIENDVRATLFTSDSIRRLPIFWQHVLKRPGVVFLSMFAMAFAIVLMIRCKPYHRAEMIGGVATDLISMDAEQAERACRAALRLNHSNYAIRKELVRILLLRGAHEDALRELDVIPAAIRQADQDHSVLLAWGLMGTGRPDAAKSVVSNIAAIVGQDQPGVAMVQAEFAAHRGDIELAAEMVVKASKSAVLTHRVRALYPYLAAAGRWDAISESASNVPYRDFSHAMIAVNACLEQKDPSGAAKVLTLLMTTHGNDPRLLKYFYVLAAIWPDSEWESTFAVKLAGSLDRLGPDDLAMWVEQSCRLRRPDLAWLAYNRLKVAESNHPAVFLMPAWMGDEWFTFQKRFLGFSSGVADDVIRLAPDMYYCLARTATPWRKAWKDIPMVGELYAVTGDDHDRANESRKKLLAMALAEFAARDTKGNLSLDMKYLYAQACDLVGRQNEAHAILSGIVAGHASESNKVLLAHAGIYQHSGDWQNVYETLRAWAGSKNAPLPAMLMFCESQFRLTLGVSALENIRRTLVTFPYSAQAATLQVRLSSMFLGTEETLLAIELLKPRMGGFEGLEIEALLKTQRFSEAKAINAALLTGSDISPTSAVQDLVLSPAELSGQWGIANIPSEVEFGSNALILERNQHNISSPFMKQLVQLWLDCNRSKCTGKDADPEKWAACGRDSMERAAALNQLTLLLCRNGKIAEARKAARMAVAEAPTSGMLRRLLIGLSPGVPGVPEEAFAACPDDSEVWLAHIVAGIDSGKAEAWAIEEVRNATKARKYPVATIVRAGDFLLGKRMVNAAAVAATDAETKARGLVPAHVLALRCAEQLQERKWALSATARAIEHSLSPQPYLCSKLIEFWGMNEKPDWDVLFALGRLRTLEPSNPLWMEMLGWAKFLAGGLNNVDARDQMKDAIAAGHTNKTAYLMLAEAERRLGRRIDAVATLKLGLQVYRNDSAMLNNLAYTLGEDAENLPEALAMVPHLLKTGGRNPDVLDTVQFIYIRSGQLSLAEQVIADELVFVAKHSTEWAKAMLRLAQIRWKEGKLEAARRILSDLVKSCPLNIPADDLYDLGKLMAEIEEKLYEQKWPVNFH